MLKLVKKNTFRANKKQNKNYNTQQKSQKLPDYLINTPFPKKETMKMLALTLFQQKTGFSKRFNSNCNNSLVLIPKHRQVLQILGKQTKQFSQFYTFAREKIVRELDNNRNEFNFLNAQKLLMLNIFPKFFEEQFTHLHLNFDNFFRRNKTVNSHFCVLVSCKFPL